MIRLVHTVLLLAPLSVYSQEINPSAGFFAATGVGLYVTLIGGLVALAGVLLKKPASLNA